MYGENSGTHRAVGSLRGALTQPWVVILPPASGLTDSHRLCNSAIALYAVRDSNPRLLIKSQELNQTQLTARGDSGGDRTHTL